VAGRPVKAAFPVATVQVGSVTDSIMGARGVSADMTFTVLAIPVPQVLIEATEIKPPGTPAVVAMDVEVELPLHPEGRVHA
jgi:hypothetical protein